jgi:hypothetical protein
VRNGRNGAMNLTTYRELKKKGKIYYQQFSTLASEMKSSCNYRHKLKMLFP